MTSTPFHQDLISVIKRILESAQASCIDAYELRYQDWNAHIIETRYEGLTQS